MSATTCFRGGKKSTPPCLRAPRNWCRARPRSRGSTTRRLSAGTHGPQRATMKLDVDGQIRIEEAEGNGPVDAVFNCIKALVPHEAKLELYQVHAVTEGTDAQAEVSVRLAHEGRSMTSKASDPDTLVASAKAYLGALNKIVMKRERDMPAVAAS